MLLKILGIFKSNADEKTSNYNVCFLQVSQMFKHAKFMKTWRKTSLRTKKLTLTMKINIANISKDQK